VQEEERTRNEANLMTLVSDSISTVVFFFSFVILPLQVHEVDGEESKTCCVLV
jgi:hypothetical protein